jgi:hypothetical protein
MCSNCGPARFALQHGLRSEITRDHKEQSSPARTWRSGCGGTVLLFFSFSGTAGNDEDLQMRKIPAFATAMKLALIMGMLAALAIHTSAFAEDKPSGKIQFEIYKAGVVVGVSGGSGTLTFNGKDYPITIGGISLGATIGASKADFVGDVFNLSAVDDIEGVYSGAKAGIAVAGGEKVAELKNSKGAVLKVSGKQIGVELTLDLNGMQISLKK